MPKTKCLAIIVACLLISLPSRALVPKFDASNTAAFGLEGAIMSALNAQLVQMLNASMSLEERLAEVERANLMSVISEATDRRIDTLSRMARQVAILETTPLPDSCEVYRLSSAASRASNAAYEENRPDVPISLDFWSALTGHGDEGLVGGNSRKELISTVTELRSRLLLSGVREGDDHQYSEHFSGVMSSSPKNTILDEADATKISLLGNANEVVLGLDARTSFSSMDIEMFSDLAGRMAVASIAEQMFDHVLEPRRKASGNRLNRSQYASLIGLPEDDPYVVSSFRRMAGSDGRVAETLELSTSAAMTRQFNQLSSGQYVDQSEMAYWLRELAIAAAAAYRQQQEFSEKSLHVLANATQLASELSRAD